MFCHVLWFRCTKSEDHILLAMNVDIG
jgi:hypothetical protein